MSNAPSTSPSPPADPLGSVLPIFIPPASTPSVVSSPPAPPASTPSLVSSHPAPPAPGSDLPIGSVLPIFLTPASSPFTTPVSSPPAPPPPINSTPFPTPPSQAASSPGIAPAPSSHVSRSSSSNSSSAGVGIGIGVAVAVILIIVIGFLLIWRRRKRRMSGHESQQSEYNPSADPPSNIDEDSPVVFVPPNASPAVSGGTTNRGDFLEGSSHLGPRSFSYEELRIATNNFSKSELLGAGGFGFVYRGMLDDNIGTLVAVKCIAENSNQGAKEYQAEVIIISNLRHRNLVRLRGWCHDQGKLLLVYDYMPNGSLDYILFNDELSSQLNWETRYTIACGLGSALQYLHEECDNVIIHRDIKSSNVLLDESYNAKLGDFGLSRQVDKGITSLSTTVAGTHGYMAPEFLLGHRRATRETDVYAFGVVLLELVCGKRAIDRVRLPEHEGTLVDWVWDFHSQDKLMEAVDKRLEGRYEIEVAMRILKVGLLCSNPDPKARPKIRRALDVLLGSVPLPFLPSSKPILTFGPPPILEDSSTSSSTTHPHSTPSSTHPYSTASSDYGQRLP